MQPNPTNKTYQLAIASQDDLAQIVAIFNQGIGVANAEFAPVSVSSRQGWFDAHGANRPIIVLKDGVKVAAWASLSDLYARPAYVHSVEISVYVDRRYQGKGFGGILVNELLRFAQTHNIYSVVALIFAHNTASLGLFKKLGFVQWGYMPNVCLSQGQLADVVMLGKSL